MTRCLWRGLFAFAMLSAWCGSRLWAADAASSQDRITIDFHDADVRQALRALDLKMTGATFVIDEEVQGTVTLKLIDAPVKEALERITKASGLTYRAEQRGTVVHVMKRPSSTTKEQ